MASSLVWSLIGAVSLLPTVTSEGSVLPLSI